MAFDDDLALDDLEDGARGGTIRDAWWAPRGPLGGYVMALIMRAIVLEVADPARVPRSLTVHFPRPPEAGPIVIRATVERAGRSLTTASARLEQNGKLLALALAALSVPWESPLLDEAPIPDVEPAAGRHGPDEVPIDSSVQPPPFTEQLTRLSRFGPPPFSGGDTALTGGWLGLREERPVDAETVLVLADAWYPAPWPRLKALAPAPTIDMTVHFRAPLPLPDSLLLGRFRTRLVRDGFFEEDGELWAPDGTLVAQSRQLGLLLGAEA